MEFKDIIDISFPGTLIGQSEGTDVTSGDSFEASGNPSKTLCYCNQRLTVTVYSDWDNTSSASVMSTSLEVLYGVGCEEEEAEYYDDVSTEMDGDRRKGTYSITWRRSDSAGKCKEGANVDPGLGDTGDDCLFTWGSFVGRVFESEDCATTATATPASLGVSSTVCAPPGWANGLLGDAEYARRCPNGGATPPTGGWCDLHPRNWKGSIKGTLDKMLKDLDMDWEDSNGAKRKCAELQG
jgi:hypothetical protein